MSHTHYTVIHTVYYVVPSPDHFGSRTNVDNVTGYYTRSESFFSLCGRVVASNIIVMCCIMVHTTTSL